VTTAAPSYTTAQSAPLSLDTAGALRVAGAVSCSNCTGSGASIVDNAAFTFGTTSIAPIGGVFDDTSSNTATENSAAIARITASKALHVNLRNSAGTEITPGTDYTQDAALTVATTAGPMGMGRASAAAPTDVTAGNDAVMNWSNLAGAQAVFLTGTSNAILPGTASDGLLVNLGANNDVTVTGTVTVASHAVTNAGTFATQVDGAALTALQLIDDDQTGSTAKSVISTANNNFTDVKTAAGRLLGMHLVNTTASLAYIKFYNDAAMVTGDCASATNLIFTMPIPASTTGAGFAMNFGPSGIAFSTGIGYCIVAGATTTDNTSTTTGIIGVVTYK
jgi:hypothetical protein